MKRSGFFTGLIAPVASILLAPCAMAADITFQPRVSTGYQIYNYDSLGNSFDFTDGYVFAGAGLTAQIDRFFADIYGQTNLTKATDLSGEDDRAFLAQNSEVDRYELNGSVGYAVLPYLSLLGGIKFAVTQFDAEIVDNRANGNQDETALYVGPYLGASAALPVGQVGSFALSGSLAFLFGDVDTESVIDRRDENDNVINTTVQKANEKGTSLGANVGLAWIGNLNGTLPGLGYTLGVDYSAYKFEDGGDDLIRERTGRIRLDLKYRF